MSSEGLSYVLCIENSALEIYNIATFTISIWILEVIAMPDKTHALVIGGSLAGLLAGRALANHFDHVTILERDVYPQQPAPRPGLPQSRFPHTLMLRGQQILEQFFPGLKADLLAQGAITVDSCQDIAALTAAGWAARSPSDLILLACSRDLLDWNVRHRLRSLSNVEFLEGASVTRLLANTEKTQVMGVSARIRSTSNGETTRDLYADLVVDASGKASHAPQWLQALGYAPPQETQVNALVGYTARLYQPPSHTAVDWKLLFIQPNPPKERRGGAIFPIEGNRWIVSLSGGDQDYPPTDEAGFLAFARSLPSPALFDAIQEATPLAPIYTYRSNENRLRHYESMMRQPEQFVVVGQSHLRTRNDRRRDRSGLTESVLSRSPCQQNRTNSPASKTPGKSASRRVGVIRFSRLPLSQDSRQAQQCSYSLDDVVLKSN
jgi:2-polyprenyl-6-methoxyphenol hydroxylase-like FAD-dependent oxidoreductase